MQTMTGEQKVLRVSRNGSGRDHWHLVISKTRGLNGAVVTRSFETRYEATAMAEKGHLTFLENGYDVRETWSGGALKISKGLETRYLFVRPCNLRHAR